MYNYNHSIRPKELQQIIDFVLKRSVDREFVLSFIYGTSSEPVNRLGFEGTTDIYRCYMLAIGADDLLNERELDMAMRRQADWDRAMLLCAIDAARKGNSKALDQVFESFQQQSRYAAR